MGQKCAGDILLLLPTFFFLFFFFTHLPILQLRLQQQLYKYLPIPTNKMAMLPIVIGAMFAGTIVFVGGGIMKARGDPIFLGGGTPHHPPKDWRKRDADDRLMRALYIIPQGSAKYVVSLSSLAS